MARRSLFRAEILQYTMESIRVDDLDQLLTTTGLRHPTFRLVKQGEELPRPSYTVGPLECGTGALDGFIGLEQVRAEMKQGATLVLVAVQRLLGPIAQLSRLFEQRFRCPAPVNLYCTPAGAQGFQPHFDVQNVFVLWLPGTKHWQVYTPHIDRPVRARPMALLPEVMRGHGGGDFGLMDHFIDGTRSPDGSEMLASPREILESHLMAFAVERSRLEGRTVRLCSG